MSHAGKQCFANNRGRLTWPGAKDFARHECRFQRDLQFRSRCDFGSATSRLQSRAKVCNGVRLYGIEQLRALWKQLQERLSSALGLFQIIDIKWRAVALQQLAAEVTVHHGSRKKTSGQ